VAVCPSAWHQAQAVCTPHPRRNLISVSRARSAAEVFRLCKNGPAFFSHFCGVLGVGSCLHRRSARPLRAVLLRQTPVLDPRARMLLAAASARREIVEIVFALAAAAPFTDHPDLFTGHVAMPMAARSIGHAHA
jgi:hypothetical protein